MSTSMDKLAKELKKQMSASEARKPSPYDAQAEVLRIEGDTAWVHIPGGVEETPVQLSIDANEGDYVHIRVANGSAWITGNTTRPPTDDAEANAAKKIAVVADDKATTALESIDGIDTRVQTAESKLDTIEENIETLETDVSTAQSNITVIQNNITALQGDVSTAQSDISTIQGNITTLQGDVSTAQSDISTIQGDIVVLEQNVEDAQDDIDDALTGLALAENVIGTLNWLTAHSKVTTDTTPASGKSYYIKNPDGTFEIVEDTTGKNPSQEGWYEMDEAISNYVAAHLSLTTYGLNLTLDNNSYRIHIGTLTADGDDGVYIIDEHGNVVSYFGESVSFDSSVPFHIGTNTNYILWNPVANRIEIGGDVLMGDDRTLDEVLTELNDTLIYDHSYTYTARDSATNNPTEATFTAFVYRGGVDVKTEFQASQFTWYMKTEDGESYLGSGYTQVVDISDCGYGAEIIGKFTLTENSRLLNRDYDSLTDSDDTPFTARSTGSSVRVSDLTVSTIIFPSDKLMVVGAEDEHLISMQTLQDYLNANLDKQVLFNTTSGWNSQTSLVSKVNTLYIYTDHQTDGQGNNVAGIKVGDGSAYVVDLPFTDVIATEHIEDTTIHVTESEKNFWNNKVRCYYASGDNLIFTTT